METIFISSNKNTGPIQLIGEGEDLSDVSIASILDLYKRHGLIWFRNFKTDVELFEEFSQSFTEKFLVFPQASDVRKALNSDGSLKTVDLSPRPIPLHSEMAYMPEGLKPEIAWFYCASASDGSGATTAADGAELANLLRDSSKYDSLLSKDILYTQEWDMDRWRQFTGAETVDELDEWIKSKGYFDVMKIDSEGVLHLSRISPLLTKPKFQEQSVFVNTTLHQNYRSERSVPVSYTHRTLPTKA